MNLPLHTGEYIQMTTWSVLELSGGQRVLIHWPKKSFFNKSARNSRVNVVHKSLKTIFQIKLWRKSWENLKACPKLLVHRYATKRLKNTLSRIKVKIIVNKNKIQTASSAFHSNPNLLRNPDIWDLCCRLRWDWTYSVLRSDSKIQTRSEPLS